ncbi:unnamed protein product [Dovyalis caffra]|uniref:Uncharacterized protein n=1 Tax=Dovyalis caffra TaxID=77055 RepID=A0AAV1S0E8_9ROSI|nr:unnamed protein product [Dovyalis caffra]
MRRRGPSPIVPSLMVGVLGLLIFGPMISSLAEYVLPLFHVGDEDVAFNFWMVLPLLLLLLIHLISSCFPSRGNRYFGTKQGSSSSSYDADGYGLGSLLLLVIFFVLYNVW